MCKSDVHCVFVRAYVSLSHPTMRVGRPKAHSIVRYENSTCVFCSMRCLLLFLLLLVCHTRQFFCKIFHSGSYLQLTHVALSLSVCQTFQAIRTKSSQCSQAMLMRIKSCAHHEAVEVCTHATCDRCKTCRKHSTILILPKLLLFDELFEHEMWSKRNAIFWWLVEPVKQALNRSSQNSAHSVWISVPEIIHPLKNALCIEKMTKSSGSVNCAESC